MSRINAVNKKRENVYAYVFNEEWFDIGIVNALEEAKNSVEENAGRISL